MDWGNEQEFLEKVFRKSKSIHSLRAYRFGLGNFKDYCDEKRVRTINAGNVYSVLDGYVGHLDKRGLKPKTILDYISAVRKYLAYSDIQVDAGKFRAKVTMPKVTKIADEPLAIGTVRTLLMKGRPTPRTRALILTLLSSGMRVGEALSMRWGDMNLVGSPATVRLKAEYVKTREARTVYVSDEARDALGEIRSEAGDGDLVFAYAGDIWQREKEAGHTFRKTVKRAGLDDLIEGHRTHKIHFHAFRKTFLTKAVDTLGDHAGHALAGHGFYMDTYYRKSEEERAGDYLKLMPKLTVFGKGEGTDLKTELKREILLSVAGYSKDEIERLGLMTLPDDEYKQKVREKLVGAMVNNGARQRVVPFVEVKGALAEGWEFVAMLPNSEAILKLPM